MKLAKVKGHAGCQLNEMAYELADQSRASDEEPVLPGPGPKKYGSLLLCFRTSMRNLLEDETWVICYPETERPIKHF